MLSDHYFPWRAHPSTVALIGILSLLASVSVLRAQEPSAVFVTRIVIDGSINPVVAQFVQETIQTAHHSGAQALVIQLDTPGGLLTSTQTIVKAIFAAPVPVIVYVAPGGAGAGSAGMFITLAAHIAAMAPGTHIGAAHPIALGGQESSPDADEKLENFVAAYSKTIAQRRRRNVEWAIQAVRESVAVTDAEALQLEVIDFVARDLRDLLQQVSGHRVSVPGKTITLSVAEADIRSVDMRLSQKIFNLLADPNVAYLLMMAGLLGLYLEFSNPGLLFPGVTGAICLLLALAASQVLPINSTGVALILLGTALIIAEAFVPSFGVLGLGGIVAFVLGSFILFDTADEQLMVAREIIVTVVVVMSGALLALSYLVLKAQLHKTQTGVEGLIGEVGRVMKRIAPTGTVQVHGEIWTAKSNEPIEIGESVQIQSVENLRLWVQRRLPNSAKDAPKVSHF